MATLHSILAWRIHHGQRSLVGYSPPCHKELDTAERLHSTQNFNEVSPHSGQNGHQQKVNNKRCKGYGEKGILLHCWGKCKLVQPIWRFFKKLKKKKKKLLSDLSLPLLGIYPEKTISQKDTGTPMFIVAPFTITKS